MEKVKYFAKGLVLGNCWGGGGGAYAARKVESEDKTKMLASIESMLRSGMLDSGMGFESLIGAVMEITTVTTIKRKGKEYRNEETEDMFFGKMTEEQESFLLACIRGDFE